jgi:hypothetical protein
MAGLFNLSQYLEQVEISLYTPPRAHYSPCDNSPSSHNENSIKSSDDVSDSIFKVHPIVQIYPWFQPNHNILCLFGVHAALVAPYPNCRALCLASKQLTFFFFRLLVRVTISYFEYLSPHCSIGISLFFTSYSDLSSLCCILISLYELNSRFNSTTNKPLDNEYIIIARPAILPCIQDR